MIRKIRLTLQKHGENILIVLALIVIYGFILAIFFVPYLFSLLRENAILILAGLVLLIVAILMRESFRERTEERRRLKEYEEIKFGRTHPLFYNRILKVVDITTNKGNASIEYFMDCQNISGKPLEQITHTISHDGGLASLEGSINKVDAGNNLDFEKFVRQRIDSKKPIERPFEVKLVYNLKKKNIQHREYFSYGYRMDFKEVYKEMFKRGKESSSVRIKNPTKLYTITIDAPNDLNFVQDGIYIKIVDMHEVEDSLEMEQCLKMHPPKIIKGGKRILWDVALPKIASRYILYFQVGTGDG